jgi:hypothetical protein
MIPLRIKIPKAACEGLVSPTHTGRRGTVCEGLVSPTHTSPTLFKNLQLAFIHKQELKIASSATHQQLYTGETITKKETIVRFGCRMIYYF